MKSKRQPSSPPAPQTQDQGGKSQFMSECLHEAIKLVVFIPQSRPFWVFRAQAESVREHSVAKWEWGPVCRNAPAGCGSSSKKRPTYPRNTSSTCRNEEGPMGIQTRVSRRHFLKNKQSEHITASDILTVFAANCKWRASSDDYSFGRLASTTAA